MAELNFCFSCMGILAGEFETCPHCGKARDSVQNTLHQIPVGTVLTGKYLVGRVLGQGGFGITYIGYDLALGLKVAIKEFFPQGIVTRVQNETKPTVAFDNTQGEWFHKNRDHFINEARILAKFNRLPHIVDVRDFFIENGTAYIVMDYVNGKTLKQLAIDNGGSLPVDTVLDYLIPLMESLQEIHAAGLLHRDIAPDNIIIDAYSNQAVLLDFGAARQMSTAGEYSLSISVKQGYSPVEQYVTRGEQGAWTDVYSLCASIYRLITGQSLMPSIDRLVDNSKTKSPAELGVNISKSVNDAIMKGVSLQAKDRQQSVAELISDLKKQGEPVKLEEASPVISTNSVKQGNTKPQAPSTVSKKPSAKKAKAPFTRMDYILIGVILIILLALFFVIQMPAGSLTGTQFIDPKYSTSQTTTQVKPTEQPTQLSHINAGSGLFTADELKSLNKRAASLLEDHNCAAYIVITDKSSAYGDMNRHANELFSEMNADHSDTPGAILLVNTKNGRYALSSYGFGTPFFSDSKRALFETSFRDKIATAKYKDICSVFLSICEEHFIQSAGTHISDLTGVLSADDIKSLEYRSSALRAKHNSSAYIVIDRNFNGYSNMITAANSLFSDMNAESPWNHGFMLIISTENKTYRFSSYGYISKNLNELKDEFAKQFDKRIASSDYDGICADFFSICEEYLTQS